MGLSPSTLIDRVGYQVPNSATETSSPIIRNSKQPNKIISLPFEDEPDVNTLWRIFERATKKFKDNDMLGYRPVNDEGSVGPYTFETYGQVGDEVAKIGSAIAQLNLDPHSTISIFGVNSMGWVKSLLAVWRQGHVCVPLYDTLGAESSKFILRDAKVTTVFCEKAKIDQVLEVVDHCDVTTVIQFEPVDDEHRAKVPEGVTLLSLDEFKAQAEKAVPPADISPDDLAYVMYTSGTTGNPKGVRLSHCNVVTSTAGLLGMNVTIYQHDVYLSYLPLAHIFEAIVEVMCFTGGASIGFYQGNVRLLMDDIQALRPTVFAGVPRVYSRFYDKVTQTVESSGWLKQTLFNFAMGNQLGNVQNGTRNALWDALIFNKTKERLGGRIRLMVSGAAPLPAHIMDFLKVVFCCDVLQGYGMTENAAAACATPLGYARAGTIGEPVPCCEIKLEDVPELEYTSKDKPFPRGEICIRGKNVFHGYHNLPDKTAETLVDGWLHTGDIGQIVDDGSIQVIDRKKNIFKLAHGEYVAAEELEGIFHRSKYIGQIFVYGDSTQPTLVAIVVPDKETLEPWLREQGIEGDFATATQDPRVNVLLLEEIKREGKAAKLASFKIPKAVHVEGEVNELMQGFTVQNGCLTPTFKLRRPQLKARYLKQINDMYAHQASK
ncbi:acyl-CoA synthetase [Salpingoeca rosetta]|uniref:Long-chain-fatty-acid--CoA ligase n=1 Tax=Salpingoeca rosetta (strain ATCC 50818 / BSB-021) TaxID=946362 RepID=F2UFA8_SALR5|nr:acyl-CoA synthetase [Salpingoeca rosetta]EGD75308.1 acyl-CoA synthetase [Salpingoeca rosetta]|eukprot:XP_004992361.1 acyl-CoA synthetase [Salpingoeca rosetta]